MLLFEVEPVSHPSLLGLGYTWLFHIFLFPVLCLHGPNSIYHLFHLVRLSEESCVYVAN